MSQRSPLLGALGVKFTGYLCRPTMLFLVRDQKGGFVAWYLAEDDETRDQALRRGFKHDTAETVTVHEITRGTTYRRRIDIVEVGVEEEESRERSD